MNDGDAAKREANLGILKQAFERISTGRHAEVGPLVSEDIEFELPYGPGRKAIEVRGRDAFLALNASTWPAFRRFTLEITRTHEMLDPEAWIVEYRSDGEIIATGKPYVNRYIGVFGFRDGLIRAWREFHNPDVPAWAFAPDPPAPSAG
jgi:ketosteroid isomerase-like protein